jgi:D-alanyl-D-alanine carboxypeptidase
MPRFRCRTLLVAGLSSSLPIGLAIADTAAATTPPPSGASASSTPSEPSTDDALDAVLVDALGDQDGAIVVLSIRDGESTTAAVGDANAAGDPIAADTSFRVGSLSKMFVATMVMQLVDEGLVDLDQPLSTYLPDASLGGDATVRQLLGHRSGLPSDLDAIADDLLADRERVFTPDDMFALVAEMPRHQPGEQFAYANTNYLLLGQLIEQLEGSDLNTVLRQRIGEPLGLEVTHFAATDTPDPEGMAGGWSQIGALNGDPDEPYTSIASGAWAAGALISTADEIADFMAALFGGGLVSQESLAEMTTLGPEGYGLGLGGFVLPDGTQMYGHEGGIFGYTAGAIHDPNTGDTLVVLTNNDLIAAPEVGFRILEDIWLGETATSTTTAA